MSNIPISSLPIVITLTGSEQVPVVQGGTTKRATTGQIAALSATGTGALSTFVLVSSNAGLPNSRTLAAESTVLSLTDGGALGPLTLGVATNGITNAKLAQMADQTLKGNISGGTANASDLTTAQVMNAIYTPIPVSMNGVYNVPNNALDVVISKTDGANVVLGAIASKIGPVRITSTNADVHPFNVTVTDGSIMGLSTYTFTQAYQSASFYPYVAGTVWTT
jgi:hypothetical protein